MGIESALTTELESDATLSGLSVNVYPHVAPKGAEYPFIVYSILGAELDTFINAEISSSIFTEQNMDLSVFSESVSQREQIITRIKNLLHGFAGNLGTENLNIQTAKLQSVSTFSETELTGTDEQIYRASLDLVFFYNWS